MDPPIVKSLKPTLIVPFPHLDVVETFHPRPDYGKFEYCWVVVVVVGCAAQNLFVLAFVGFEPVIIIMFLF